MMPWIFCHSCDARKAKIMATSGVDFSARIVNSSEIRKVFYGPYDFLLAVSYSVMANEKKDNPILLDDPSALRIHERDKSC